MGCLGSSCCAFINSHHPTTTSDYMLRAASTFGGRPSPQMSSMQWCIPAKLLQSSTTTHWRNGDLKKKEKRTCVLFYFLLPNQPHTGEVRPETAYHIMYASLPLSSGAIIIQHSRAGSRSQVGEDSGCARSGITSYGEKPGQKETQKKGEKKKERRKPHWIIVSLYLHPHVR